MKNLFNYRLTYLLIFFAIFSLAIVFFKHNNYYSVFPIKINKRNHLPYIEAKIEEVCYPLLFDLGSRLELTMHDDLLDKLHNKVPSIKEKWKNFRGSVFESQAYLLPKLEIGTFIFKKPLVVGYPKEREQEYIVNPNSETSPSKQSETVGELGRGLLKKVNLLIDIKSMQVILTPHLSKLKKDKYAIESFIKIPFDLDPKGITIEIFTDLGKLRFILDTGFTCTVLHKSLYPENLEKKENHYGLLGYTTNQFNIQGVDFEPQDLSFIEMTEELRVIDGILGMDFIKSHVMYIDFPKKTLYIQK